MGFFAWFRSSSSRRAKIEDFLTTATNSIQRGNYEDAFDAATSVLNLDKENLAALNIRGVCFMRQKEDDLALADFEKIILLSPRYYPAIVNKGLIRMHKRNFDSAIHHFNSALTLSPDDATIYNNLGFCKALTGNFPSAIADLKAITLAPEFAFPYNNRGFAKMNLDDFNGAEDDINTSLELDSLNSYAYKNRGLLYLRTKREKQACLEFFKARQLGYSDIYDNEVNELIEKNCKVY